MGLPLQRFLGTHESDRARFRLRTGYQVVSQRHVNRIVRILTPVCYLATETPVAPVVAYLTRPLAGGSDPTNKLLAQRRGGLFVFSAIL